MVTPIREDVDTRPSGLDMVEVVRLLMWKKVESIVEIGRLKAKPASLSDGLIYS